MTDDERADQQYPDWRQRHPGESAAEALLCDHTMALAGLDDPRLRVVRQLIALAHTLRSTPASEYPTPTSITLRCALPAGSSTEAERVGRVAEWARARGARASEVAGVVLSVEKLSGPDSQAEVQFVYQAALDPIERRWML